MDYHGNGDALQKICRIRRRKFSKLPRATKYPAHMLAELKACFCLNVDVDQEEIHPPSIYILWLSLVSRRKQLLLAGISLHVIEAVQLSRSGLLPLK